MELWIPVLLCISPSDDFRTLVVLVTAYTGLSRDYRNHYPLKLAVIALGMVELALFIENFIRSFKYDWISEPRNFETRF